MVGRDMSGIDNAVKAELRLGSRVCQCADCDLFFGSASAFDNHRVGGWEQRRCLTSAGMTAIGMVTNTNGVWITGTSTGKGTGRKRKKAA